MQGFHIASSLPHWAGSEHRSARKFDISFAEPDKHRGQHKSLTTDCPGVASSKRSGRCSSNFPGREPKR
jgi:hypothetical protein